MGVPVLRPPECARFVCRHADHPSTPEVTQLGICSVRYFEHYNVLLVYHTETYYYNQLYKL